MARHRLPNLSGLAGPAASRALSGFAGLTAGYAARRAPVER